MRLPDEITVEVRSEADGRPIEGVLVWLATFAFHREHYRTVIGVTNRRGQVSTGRAKLLTEYRQAQHDFPMDYELALEQGDERIAVGVHGGESFTVQRLAARESGVVSPDFRRMWDVARNEAYGSANVDVEEQDLRAGRLRIELVLPGA